MQNFGKIRIGSLFALMCITHVSAALVPRKTDLNLASATLLKTAIDQGNLQNVQEIIESKASLITTPINPEQDITPLMYAAAVGNAIIVEDFLARNVSLFDVDRYGQNVLHYLMKIEWKNHSVEPMNIEQNIKNRLIILNLILFKNQKNWRLLVQTDIQGQSPLHHACYYGLMPLVEALLPYAPPVIINLPDVNLITPLRIAVGRGHSGIIKLLLKHHATCDPLTMQDVVMNQDQQLFELMLGSMTSHAYTAYKPKK